MSATEPETPATVPERVQAAIAAALAERVENCPEGRDPIAGLSGKLVTVEGLRWRIVSLSWGDGKAELVLECADDLTMTVPVPGLRSPTGGTRLEGIIR